MLSSSETCYIVCYTPCEGLVATPVIHTVVAVHVASTLEFYWASGTDAWALNHMSVE